MKQHTFFSMSFTKLYMLIKKRPLVINISIPLLSIPFTLYVVWLIYSVFFFLGSLILFVHCREKHYSHML